MFVSQIIEEAMEVLGTTDKTKVYRKISQAVKTLMQSGHYFHTISEVDVCTGWDNQTITLPRGIETPLAVNVDGSPTYFRDRLFQYHVSRGGMYNPVQWAWDDRGMVATQMDIRQPSQLVAVAEHEADAGKVLRVIGTDENNRDLRTQSVDGAGLDGVLVPIHSINDFPLGTIQPDGVTIQTRSAKVSPLNTFVSSTAHQLSSGEGAILSLVSGTMPPELEAGKRYWVGAASTSDIQLYNNELDAKAQIEPISVSSIVGSPALRLTDSRDSQLYTALKLSATPQVPIAVGTEATFAPASGGVLPSPLVENKTYFITQIEPTVLQIFETLTDAQNEINPVLLIGTNSNFTIYPRSQITPETKLIFPESHGYQNGDIVQAFTNGGTLPQPLIAGTNYYVHVIDSLNEHAVTLHFNYADSLSGNDPINLITSGVGQNSIAKLFPATANPGTKNNINVAGLNLPQATGSGAIVTPIVTGSVTSATLVSGGNGYQTASATVSDAGGYKYLTSPAVVIGGTFTSPAIAVATVTKDEATGYGYVSSIAMASMGSGYNLASPPAVSFVGGLDSGGFAAKAEAVVTKGVSLGVIPSSLITSGGQGHWVGQIVFFKDTSGNGSGALGRVNSIVSGTSSVESIEVTKTGYGYTTPVIAGLFQSRILVLWGAVTSSASLQYINVFTLNSGSPVNILNGTILPWITTVASGCTMVWNNFTNSVISAVNSNTANTLYWADIEDQFTSIAVSVYPCVKFSVLSIGNTNDVLQSLSLKYLKNGNSGFFETSESEFEILPTSGVTQTAGITTPALFASAIASAINTYSTSTNVTSGAVTNSNSITLTAAPSLRFKVGARITGAGIPADPCARTFIKSISGNTIYLCNSAGEDVEVTVSNGVTITASNGISAISSGSDVIVRPKSFVQSLAYQVSTTRLTFSFVLPDYPINWEVNPDFMNGTVAPPPPPVVPNVPSSGVVSSVNLLPVGSGASVNVSVNSVTNTVNGLSIASIGTDYQYPPRVKLTSPNIVYPTIQVTSVTSGTSTIASITATSTTGVSDELLKGVSITSITSLADAASKIVVGINNKTALSGYSAALSSESNDTVILYPPSGVSVKSNGISIQGVAILFNYLIPIQALASLGVTTSGVTGYVVQDSGSGYTTAPAVNIKGGGGSGASATAVLDENGIGSISVISGGSGYPAVLNAVISDLSGAGSGCTVSVVVVGGAIDKVNVLTPGKGYIQPAITFLNPSGSQMGIGASVSFTKTGVVANVNVVTEGTGYTSLPTVTVQPSTGIFVQFSSTGTLPSPIVQGNTYRAENPSSASTFTLKNNDFSDVNITSTGSGTIYLVLSRAFSIGFTGNWDGDFTGITTSTIRLQTDYQLPVTSPSTDTATNYTLQKVTNTRAIIRTIGGGNLQIIPTQLGVGQSYYAIPTTTTVNVYNNQILPSSTEYLIDGMTVQFSSSSGTLPSPLVAGTDYKIYLSGKFLTVKTTGGTSVVFTTLGNSQLYMNIIRNFTPKPASTVMIGNCIFETGDKISVRPISGDTLPSPLSGSTTYYAGRSGDDLLLICSSSAAALAKTPIQLFSTGNTVDSSFIIDSIKDPTLVKAIYHVEKPLTLGYVSLYAFDYGRSNDMALIGQYHPSEVNPKYRRIRIGKPCAWVRMAYQVRPVDISSDSDYIPLENERAVLTALHACDLEDKDFLEQAQKYWATAITYLRQETESLGGHAMIAPQINNITYGDGTDPIVN